MPTEPDFRQHPTYLLIMDVARKAHRDGWPPVLPMPLVSTLFGEPCIPAVDNLTVTARSQIATAAKLICGKVPEPKWLRPALERIVAAELMLHLKCLPDATFKEVAADIHSAAEAAETLHSLIAARSPAIFVIATADEDDSEPTAPSFREFFRLLDDAFLPRARLALAEAQATSAPKTRTPGTRSAPRIGRKKRFEMRRTATEICAVTTNEAWKIIYGAYPSKTSDEACGAAEALFSAAGWQPSTYNQQPSSSGRWQRHLASTRPSKSDDDYRNWFRAQLRTHFDGQFAR